MRVIEREFVSTDVYVHDLICTQASDSEDAEEVRQARRALELLELAKKEAQVFLLVVAFCVIFCTL